MTDGMTEEIVTAQKWFDTLRNMFVCLFSFIISLRKHLAGKAIFCVFHIGK